MDTPPSGHPKQQQTADTLTALVTDTTSKDIQPGNVIVLPGAKGDDNMTPHTDPACNLVATMTPQSLRSLRDCVQK